MKFITKLVLFTFIFTLTGSYLSAHKNGGEHEPMKKMAHADHNPKHGGQFFMAPDRSHHLEGVMASSTEFRIYFYDNHSKPIPATSFEEGSKVEVQRVGPDGRETGTPVPLPVTVDPSGSFLIASVPGELKLPLYFTTWLMFPNQKEPELFNFTFDKVSDQHKHSK